MSEQEGVFVFGKGLLSFEQKRKFIQQKLMKIIENESQVEEKDEPLSKQLQRRFFKKSPDVSLTVGHMAPEDGKLKNYVPIFPHFYLPEQLEKLKN